MRTKKNSYTGGQMVSSVRSFVIIGLLVFGGALLSAGQSALASAGTAVYFVHTNHLGTPQALTDESGAVAWEADYEPFGDVIETISAVSSNLRFPGQYFDQETGLHYNYFRYYSPSDGRYLRADPTGLDADINVYAYGMNNPIIFIDRNGLEASFSSNQYDEFADSNAALAQPREIALAASASIGIPLIPIAVAGAFIQSVPIGLTAVGFGTTGVAFLIDPTGDNAARIAMDILPFCAVPFLPVAGAAGAGVVIGGSTITAAGSVAGGAALINVSFDIVSLIPRGLNNQGNLGPLFPEEIPFSPLPECRQDPQCLASSTP